MLRIDVVTLFPELFDLPLRTSVIGRAVERGLVEVVAHDLREHGLGRHRSVDDYSVRRGSGDGAPARAAASPPSQPLRDAGALVILLDPAGERLTDAHGPGAGRRTTTWRWSAGATRGSTSARGRWPTAR